jgi:hypothetical protein
VVQSPVCRINEWTYVCGRNGPAKWCAGSDLACQWSFGMAVIRIKFTHSMVSTFERARPRRFVAMTAKEGASTTHQVGLRR